MCIDFFAGGFFGHSPLIPLLYDSSLPFPSEWSTQQLSSNGKSTRSQSDWAELHEEEDQPSRSEQWAQRQLGAEDMIITRNLKVRSAHTYAYTT
jgi:hypothetical protein